MEFLEDIGNRVDENPDDVCVMSGLKELDSYLHGFRRQEITYLAARPAMGKSALAMQIGLHAALRQGKQVMYASLEMGDKQIMGRAVANLTEINSEKIMFDYQLANSPLYSKVLKAATEISKSGLHIITKDISTPSEIFNKALQIQGKYGLDIIIIDHVNLMDSGEKSENQNANMTYISRTLKKMALELNVPVIALAQLSRGVESRNDKRPLLSDLRDSGSLEQDADKVLMLYRESYYTGDESNDVVEVLIRKQRDGKLGEARMRFMKQFAYMEPLIMDGRPESRSFEPPL
jgi:replicative DNA helicase